MAQFICFIKIIKIDDSWSQSQHGGQTVKEHRRRIWQLCDAVNLTVTDQKFAFNSVDT